jgi:hypothetical protein
MENDLQMRQETLMSALGNWNLQENKFRELFGDDALRDREFMKMKLDHYDGIFHKYNGRPQTQDERAMMTMLHFQRRKMERSLHPGFLRRVLHRVVARIKAVRTANRERMAITVDQRERSAQNLPPIAFKDAGLRRQEQQATIRKMPVSKYAQQNNISRANRKGKHRKHGRSM